MIKIAILDDHPLVLKGFANVIENYTQYHLTGAYNNESSMFEDFSNNLPDILLLDIQMPDKQGDEIAQIISKKFPSIQMLALTNLDSVLYANTMFQHGVKGYLLKTTQESELIKAINTVYKGEKFIDTSMIEKMSQLEQVIRKTQTLKPNLTPRETEILQLIVDGLSSTQIAEGLYLGLNTVEKYRKNILLKLDVKNTAAMVAKALKQGLAN